MRICNIKLFQAQLCYESDQPVQNLQKTSIHRMPHGSRMLQRSCCPPRSRPRLQSPLHIRRSPHRQLRSPRYRPQNPLLIQLRNQRRQHLLQPASHSRRRHRFRLGLDVRKNSFRLLLLRRSRSPHVGPGLPQKMRPPGRKRTDPHLQHGRQNKNRKINLNQSIRWIVRHLRKNRRQRSPWPWLMHQSIQSIYRCWCWYDLPWRTGHSWGIQNSSKLVEKAQERYIFTCQYDLIRKNPIHPHRYLQIIRLQLRYLPRFHLASSHESLWWFLQRSTPTWHSEEFCRSHANKKIIVWSTEVHPR